MAALLLAVVLGGPALLLPVACRRLGRPAFVLPAAGVVAALLLIEAGEEAVEVLGVAELLADDRRAVGVRHDVLAEVALVRDDVVDDAAEEGDVRARTERDVDVGDRAGPGVAGIDVDELGAPRLGFHDPLEPNRVALGHVGSLDDDAVSVLQVLLEGGGPSPAERSPQTGDRGGVSDARLVLDLDRPEGGVQ